MPDEGFLKRWSRRKIESRLGHEPEPEPAFEPQSAADAPGLPSAAQALADGGAARAGEGAGEGTATTEAVRLPTLDDVAALTTESDYSSFVARGVDQAVRRSALKKLFADPHFNTMDRLDIYIDDYTQPSPVSEAMLASLRHAARLFERVGDVATEAGATAIDTTAIDTATIEAAAARHEPIVAEAAGDPAPPAPAESLEHPQHQQHQRHLPEAETR